MLERLTTSTPKQLKRRKMWRVRGGCPSPRWTPAVRWTTAKNTAPCLPPPLAPDRLVNVSQQTVRSCVVWLKTPHQPKSCGSSRGGWSRWWRTRSRGGGDGEEVEQEAELLQRRRLQRTTLPELLMNQTKTTRPRALTAKLKSANLRTKTL